MFDIPKGTANAICAQITAVTGTRVDWHYIAGRVHMKALVAAASAPVLADERAIKAAQEVFEKWFCEELGLDMDAAESERVIGKMLCAALNARAGGTSC